MSQQNVEVVRKPLRVREQSSRTLDQRLALRFPSLFPGFARRISSLPPGSRLRQASLWRAARLALEAYNRRDLEAVVIGCHPEFRMNSARRKRRPAPEPGFTCGWHSTTVPGKSSWKPPAL